MEISFIRSVKEIPFAELETGATFMIVTEEDEIYIKVGTDWHVVFDKDRIKGGGAAISFKEGDIYYFKEETRVIPIRTELIVYLEGK